MVSEQVERYPAVCMEGSAVTEGVIVPPSQSDHLGSVLPPPQFTLLVVHLVLCFFCHAGMFSNAVGKVFGPELAHTLQSECISNSFHLVIYYSVLTRPGPPLQYLGPARVTLIPR